MTIIITKLGNVFWMNIYKSSVAESNAEKEIIDLIKSEEWSKLKNNFAM